MSIFDRFLGKTRKRSLTEKVDHIEAMVEELTDTLDNVHMDMWDKLTTLEEQGRQRPSIVLGLPQPDGSMALAGYEPGTDDDEYEAFEDFEDFDNGEEVQA